MRDLDRDLVEMIPEWLTVTQGADVATGLSREEALGRARILRRLLREGELHPEEIALDESSKDVLHALVALVTDLEPQSGPQLAREANAVYQLLRSIAWPGDALGEKQALLQETGLVGLRALGGDLAHLAGIRRDFLNGEALPSRAKQAAGSRVGLTGLSLWKVCDSLRKLRNVRPQAVRRCAIRLHRRVAESRGAEWLFDEADFFLGYSAYIAGSTSRVLGHRAEAFLWLERAERSFAPTLTPVPLLAEVIGERAALEYDGKDYPKALEFARRAQAVCEATRLWRAELKCRLVEASCLKEQERYGESLVVFESLRCDARLRRETNLFAAVLVKSFNVLSTLKRHTEAHELQREVLDLLASSNEPMAAADLKGVVGECLRDEGRLAEAVSAYRESISDYEKMGMSTFAAYVRIVLAETLLALQRTEEAEEQIRAALPTIESEKMVREGVAAMALLKESIRRRRADPDALRQLREHLQKKR